MTTIDGGEGVSVEPAASGNSFTISNTGVLSLAAGTGLSASATTGDISLANTAPNVLPYDTLIGLLGPLIWWKLADPAGSTTVADSSPNGINGAVVIGTPTFGVPGPMAGLTAVEVNGVSISRPVGQLISTIALPDVFTLISWFQTDTANAGGIASFGTGATNWCGMQMGSGATMSATVNKNGVGATIATATTYNDGAWHFAVTTFDASSTFSFYLDGALVQARAFPPGDFAQANWNLWAGNNFGAYFDGTLAQEALFSSAFTDAQVAGLFGAPRQ